MARRKKAEEPKTIKTTAKDFRNAVSEVNGAKTRAKNASSSKSTAVTDFCLRSGFGKKAFGAIVAMNDMDEFKRDDFMRQMLMGYELMGWGTQKDMFDDIGERIAAATRAAEDDEKARKGQPKGSEGLPLDQAAKKFGETAHKAPRAKRSESEPTVVFPDPPARDTTGAVA